MNCSLKLRVPNFFSLDLALDDPVGLIDGGLVGLLRFDEGDLFIFHLVHGDKAENDLLTVLVFLPRLCQPSILVVALTSLLCSPGSLLMALRVATFLLILSRKPVRLLLAAATFVGVIVLDLHTSFRSCWLDELLDDTLVGELNVSSPSERFEEHAFSC